jgi:hypothetical protein
LATFNIKKKFNSDTGTNITIVSVECIDIEIVNLLWQENNGHFVDTELLICEDVQNEYFMTKYVIMGTSDTRKSKNWLARNQDNVSKRGYMSISELLSQ